MIQILGIPYFVQTILHGLRGCEANGLELKFKYFAQHHKESILGYWNMWREERTVPVLTSLILTKSGEYPLPVPCEDILVQIEEEARSS